MLHDPLPGVPGEGVTPVPGEGVKEKQGQVPTDQVPMPKASPEGRGKGRGRGVYMDKEELARILDKSAQTGARGMARVVEKAIQEINEDGWETPEDELDRLLMIDDEHFPALDGSEPKYDASVPGKVRKWYAEAQKIVITKKGLARRLKISERTLYNWMQEKQELVSAIRAGEAQQEERLAARMASGIKYPMSVFAVLKNLHHWTDRVEETNRVEFSEAMQSMNQQAERVEWDKAARPTLPPPPSQQEAK